MTREVIKHDWKKGEALTSGWCNTVGGILTRMTKPYGTRGTSGQDQRVPSSPRLMVVTKDKVDEDDEVDSGLYKAMYRTWSTTGEKWKEYSIHESSEWLIDVRAWSKQPNDYDWSTEDGLRLMIHDVLWAIWDPVRFAFVPITPQLERRGKAHEAIAVNEKGRVDLQQALKPTDTKLTQTSRWVNAYNDQPKLTSLYDEGNEDSAEMAEIPSGQEVLIRWHQDSGRYTVLKYLPADKFKQTVRFTLDADMSTEDEGEEATITAEGQYGPGEDNPDTAITVANLLTSEAGVYVFKGDAGDAGLAIRDKEQEYKIIQMQCPTNPPV